MGTKFNIHNYIKCGLGCWFYHCHCCWGVYEIFTHPWVHNMDTNHCLHLTPIKVWVNISKKISWTHFCGWQNLFYSFRRNVRSVSHTSTVICNISPVYSYFSVVKKVPTQEYISWIKFNILVITGGNCIIKHYPVTHNQVLGC